MKHRNNINETSKRGSCILIKEVKYDTLPIILAMKTIKFIAIKLIIAGIYKTKIFLEISCNNPILTIKEKDNKG